MEVRLSRFIQKFSLGFAVVFTALGGSFLTAQAPDSAQVNDLLKQAKSEAVQANHDASLIESFTRSRHSWRNHAIQLEAMKLHVNDLGRILSELDAAKPNGSQWQQEAITGIEPLLRSMADHLSVMIDYLNANQGRIHAPEYVEYARTNRELSDNLLTTVRDYIDYSEAKTAVEVLEQRLRIPAASATH